MRLRHLLLTLATALATVHPALARPCPERPVKLVVPHAPGGSAEIAARPVAEEWGKALGTGVFIENKGGAGGNLGVDQVAKLPPDGHTVGLQTVSLAINPSLTATIAGQVDMSFPVLSAAQQHVAAGKLRAPGVTGPKRSAQMPKVPTIAEAGLPKYGLETWFMVLVPADTRAPVTEKLNTSLNKERGITAD